MLVDELERHRAAMREHELRRAVLVTLEIVCTTVWLIIALNWGGC